MVSIPDIHDFEAAVERAVCLAIGDLLETHVEEIATVRRALAPVLTLAEVARMLDCEPRHVKRHHMKRGLRAYRVAKNPTFFPDDVAAYVRRFPDRTPDFPD